MRIITILLALIVVSYLISGATSNPSVTNTVTWDSEETKLLFDRSCADCHSNYTKWPWYSEFAPASWFIINHVNEGREHFNVSTTDMGEADEAAEEVEEGEMPLDSYLWLHPEAKLTELEKEILVSGLKKTFKKSKN